MFQKRNKYKAKSTNHGGHNYHSKKEATYAAELDLRVKAGELKGYERQVRVPFEHNGVHICNYFCDFVEIYPDGHRKYVEIKGYLTDVGKLKIKMMRAFYPKTDYQVVR